MSGNQPGNGKLASWKEIATYLDRDVRTVIRWEKKRNLPVHRLPGGQAVFAYKAELDDWLKQGANKTPIPSSVLTVQPEIRLPEQRERRAFWHYTAIVGAVGVLIAIFGTSFVRRSASASGAFPTNIKFSSRSIQALDDAGRVMWTHELRTPIHPEVLKHKENLETLVRITDLFHDGSREVIVTLPLQVGPNPADPASSEVDCFSSRGTLLWSYVPRVKFQFGDHELDGPWVIEDVFASNDSTPALWMALAHYRWGNSFIIRLDAQTGKGEVRFVNTGIIYKLNEVQLAAKPYLLIGGFNNEYAAGMLAVIDEEKPYAVSPQTAGTRHKCISCGDGSPDYYFVFPRSEINRLYDSWEDSVRFVNVQGSTVEVEKAELGDPALEDKADVGKVHVVYDFRAELSLHPVAFRFDSWYDMLHRDLQTKGKLDHALEFCPERVHPAPVRLWTPHAGWSQIYLGQTTP